MERQIGSRDVLLNHTRHNLPDFGVDIADLGSGGQRSVDDDYLARLKTIRSGDGNLLEDFEEWWVLGFGKSRLRPKTSPKGLSIHPLVVLGVEEVGQKP